MTKNNEDPNKMILLDEPVFLGNEEKYLMDCINSGFISWQGKYVTLFEELFTKYVQSKYGSSTANGTSALIIALQALGIGKGDEVIVPTLTFSASAFAVTNVGANVVFADSLPNELNINPSEIEKNITSKTKAIMVVHLYGRPVNMDEIMRIAKKYNLYVVEDCAECLGALYKDKKTGSFGDISCFSFHNKLIATGEGGMIVTKDESLFNRINDLKNPSPDNRTDKNIVSLNSRMSNLNAAVGVAQLERLEEFVKIKRRNVALYESLLDKIQGIDIISENLEVRSTYWRYSVLINNNFPISRDELIIRLKDNNIVARGIFTPMHLHPVYKQELDTSFPEAEHTSSIGLDLPSSVKLVEEDIIRVVNTIENCI